MRKWHCEGMVNEMKNLCRIVIMLVWIKRKLLKIEKVDIYFKVKGGPIFFGYVNSYTNFAT